MLFNIFVFQFIAVIFIDVQFFPSLDTGCFFVQVPEFFFLGHAACGILVPQLGMELVPPAVEAWSLNWTARKVPVAGFFSHNHMVWCCTRERKLKKQIWWLDLGDNIPPQENILMQSRILLLLLEKFKGMKYGMGRNFNQSILCALCLNSASSLLQICQLRKLSLKRDFTSGLATLKLCEKGRYSDF